MWQLMERPCSRQSFGAPADSSKEPHCHVYKCVVSWYPVHVSVNGSRHYENPPPPLPPLALRCLSRLCCCYPSAGHTPRSIACALLSQLNAKSCVLDGCLRRLVSFSKFSVHDPAHSPMPINFTAHQIYLLDTMKPIALENLIENF